MDFLTWHIVEVHILGGWEEDEDGTFKRLDRVLGNQKILYEFHIISVKHLIKKGLNHSTLEVQCSQDSEIIIMPFKCLSS